MSTIRTVKPARTCAKCDGPMPSPAGRGRPAVYCSGACRKAAFEARRTNRPDAFQVRTVEREVVSEHDLNECVSRVIASPTACRRVVQAVAAMVGDGTLDSDPKWSSTQKAVRALNATVYTPPWVRR